jgi:hypothetical protein
MNNTKSGCQNLLSLAPPLALLSQGRGVGGEGCLQIK